MRNGVPEPGGPEAEGRDPVAERIARKTLARRETDYAEEVRRLLDAAVELMREHGTRSKPRVADIVAAAGLSNEAFYRHFRSKDALVLAILEDGEDRLRSYIIHQMGKESAPERKIARWIQGVLSQTEEKVAATTLAVLWNGGGVEQGSAGRHHASSTLSTLLEAPFADLGSTNPRLDAALASHATFGKLSDYLWRGTRPTRGEMDRIVAFCLAGGSASSR